MDLCESSSQLKNNKHFYEMLRKTTAFICLAVITTIGHAQISIDDTMTVQQLVEDILINSTCAEVSNFSSSTGTDFGDVNGIAAFDANGSDFPFEAGVILTSGDVQNAPGPNLTLHSDGGIGWPGDADLEAQTTATATNNASFIQFDFVPFVEEISFDFVMASEEYNDTFECTFSDAFAFILTDQTTGTIQNLAVLPGTTTPIEVTNIRYEVPGQCAAANEEYFEQYNFQPLSNASAPSIPANDSAIDFNGQTVVLTAMGTVTPGNDYTIKLVVADETDTAYDIAVFLGANSFNIGDVDLGDDILLGDGNAICEDSVITLDTMEDDPTATFLWFKDGDLIDGETSPQLDISVTGLYRVEITYNQSSTCVAVDEILVEFFPNPEFDLGPDQLVCDEETYTIDATVTNPSELTNIMYKWFKDGVEIASEITSMLDVNETGVYTAEVTGNGCIIAEDIFIEIVQFTVEIGDFINLCGEDDYEIVPEIIGADATDASYLWSTGETNATIVVSENGTYSVDVTINGCTESDDVEINFRTLPVVALGDILEKCTQDIETLTAMVSNADPATVTYTWFRDGGELVGQTASTLEVEEEGIYSVEVSNDGCVGTDDITVMFYRNANCVISEGISPNGDNFNDFLDLQFLDKKKDITKLSILNRLGTLVYEKQEYVDEWTGNTTDGAELPVGTYFYVIELSTESPITGWIYINK